MNGRFSEGFEEAGEPKVVDSDQGQRVAGERSTGA
jgi:hypothetical protein